MKKLFLAMLMFLAGVAAINTSTAFAADKNASKVIAYYFHGSARCYTCNMIEKYSKEAIRAYFKDEIDSGKLELKAVNVENKGNQHFVKDYQLYGQSLVISMLKDGKEVKSKNLNQVWQLVRNKQRFSEYVIEEIETLMKEPQ